MFGIKWNNNSIKGFTGFTIVETFVVIAVILLAFTAILGFFAFEAKVAERSRMRLGAILLSEEAIEAVRNFRDNTTWASTGVGALTIGIDYHPASLSTGWDFVFGNEIINGFTRTIVFSRVSRDANDDIESMYNPIDDDPNTRMVAITINWTDRQGSANESLITYITNWKE